MAGDPSDIRIGVDEARQKIESGGTVVLDVVQPGTWSELNRVIEGAVRIPPDEIEERFTEVPEECDIITYCT